MPWSVLKWNFTQVRSPAALTHWKVWEPKPSMWRSEAGMPRSPKSQVNWWVASGEWEKKSQTLSGSCRLVNGSYFCEWMKSGNLMPSRMKKTGVLFPTRSQLPSSV